MTKIKSIQGKGSAFGTVEGGFVVGLDTRLVSKDGERADFLRGLIARDGSLTISQMTHAWMGHKGIYDRKEFPKVRKLVETWVHKRVHQEELEAKGYAGDEYGSLLFGFVPGMEP